MRFVTCCLGLLAFTSLSVQARLGETKAQLITRFGPEAGTRAPFFPGTTHLVFSKQGFAIDVSLINGISEDEIYSDERGNLSSGDVQYLLRSNQQGHQWQEQPVGPNGRHWWKRDDGAIACQRGDDVFEIGSKIYFDKKKAYEKSQESSVQGF